MKKFHWWWRNYNCITLKTSVMSQRIFRRLPSTFVHCNDRIWRLSYTKPPQYAGICTHTFLAALTGVCCRWCFDTGSPCIIFNKFVKITAYLAGIVTCHFCSYSASAKLYNHEVIRIFADCFYWYAARPGHCCFALHIAGSADSHGR